MTDQGGASPPRPPGFRGSHEAPRPPAPRVLHDFAGWPAGPLHLAIGVFDGVHRGHQALVRHLAEGARAARAMAIAATFDPLPIEALAPAAPPSALSDADERAALLVAAGADAVALFGFDARFAALTAREFVERLDGAGDLRRVVVGPDFRFGHDRAGDVPLLRDMGRAAGFEVDVFGPIELAGGVVSSTRVRNGLAAGEVERAAELLGRPYDVPGTVVHGEKRGRGLGYPTINVATRPNRLLPKDGIYAVRARVDARGPSGEIEVEHPAAASLGVRSTFGGGPRWLEAYLLDFEGDLYGDLVRVKFVRRLRDELHFESAEALAAQIAKDVEETRRALGWPAARSGA